MGDFCREGGGVYRREDWRGLVVGHSVGLDLGLKQRSDEMNVFINPLQHLI